MKQETKVEMSFMLNPSCVEYLKSLANINSRSLSEQIEQLIVDKTNEREDDFFAHMDRKHKKIENQSKQKKI